MSNSADSSAPQALFTVRYGKLQVTLTLFAVVGIFWLVSEAVRVRSTVTAMADERPAMIEKLTRLDLAMPNIDTRLTRIEARVDSIYSRGRQPAAQ